MSDAPRFGDEDLLPEGKQVKKGTSKTCLVLGIIGGVMLFLLLCCGVGGYFLMSFSGTAIATVAKDGLNQNPVVQEHLGEITEAELLWMETFEYVGETNKQSFYVFGVKGTKGSGKVIAKVANEGGQQPSVTTEGGELRMSTGEVFPLDDFGDHGDHGHADDHGAE